MLWSLRLLTLLNSILGLMMMLPLTMGAMPGSTTLEGSRRNVHTRLLITMSRLVPPLLPKWVIQLIPALTRLAVPFPFLLFYRVLTNMTLDTSYSCTCITLLGIVHCTFLIVKASVGVVAIAVPAPLMFTLIRV